MKAGRRNSAPPVFSGTLVYWSQSLRPRHSVSFYFIMAAKRSLRNTPSQFALQYFFLFFFISSSDIKRNDFFFRYSMRCHSLSALVCLTCLIIMNDVRNGSRFLLRRL